MPQDDNLRVLQLATSNEIFFKQQIETLEQKGVDTEVLVVPGAEQVDGAMANQRGITEYLRFFPVVRRALSNGEFDLIHANYGLTAPYAITQFRIPVVLTLWGSDVVGFDGLVTKACAWRADAITVRSEEMRELLGRDDAYILPSGVDLAKFQPMDTIMARKQVGWNNRERHVLFPYSVEYERKNYPLAERITRKVENRISETVRLHTISGIPHEEVAYYYNAADAVLLTSEHEGSPNTVKEAMACNVPVVSTDVGDVMNRLKNVDPGGVGASEEELVDLLGSVLVKKRRSNGRQKVREVSWDRIGDDILSIYQSVLKA